MDSDPGKNGPASAKREDLKCRFLNTPGSDECFGKAGVSRASQSHLPFSELCAKKGACGGRNEHQRRLKEEPSEAWHSTAKRGFNGEHLKGGYDKAELLYHTHTHTPGNEV